MDRNVGIALMKRGLEIIEKQWPEMAESFMRVPLDFYNSEELAASERELFETSPLALAASAEVSQRHDYSVREALGRSILITRDGDGVAHAFLNYCTHRGAEAAQGCGNARTFACPYHAWTFDSAGRLVGMPLRDRYEGLDLSEHGLVELSSQERHGLLWVVLRPGAEIDVAAHLGELDAELASLGFGEMTYHNSIEQVQLSANWKAVSEGLMEALHVPYVHPETFALNPQAASLDLAVYDAIGPHVRYVLPCFAKEDVERIRKTPEEEWDPRESLGCVWWISPGLLLANDFYGFIYADLTPGRKVDEALLRYGWLSPTPEAPAGMLSPEEMALRARRAVLEDDPVWATCGRGLTRGAHEYALIGRNEKGVQLAHESLARQVGYAGLSYV